MTIEDVLTYSRVIKRIIDNVPEVNSLTKFKLLGMLKQFEPTVDNFNTIREEKIQKYGSYDSEGRFGIFEPHEEDFETITDFKEAYKNFEEIMNNFNKDLDEILHSESDLQIKKIKYTDIIDAGIPADYLMVLYNLIEEWFGGNE